MAWIGPPTCVAALAPSLEGFLVIKDVDPLLIPTHKIITRERTDPTLPSIQAPIPSLSVIFIRRRFQRGQEHFARMPHRSWIFDSNSALLTKFTTTVFLFFSNFIFVLNPIFIAPKPLTPPSLSLSSVLTSFQSLVHRIRPSQIHHNLFTINLHLFVASRSPPESCKS